MHCSVGANHCRLRHIGLEKCGHGLTSRPRESASGAFLDELLMLFKYPHKSSRALLAGTLPLWCRSTWFACFPTWRLPVPGHAADLVHAGVGAEGDNGAEVGDEGVHWVRGSGPGRKRLRLDRKKNQHLVGHSMQSRPRVCKRCCRC